MARPRKNVPAPLSNPPLNTAPTDTPEETPNIPGVKPPVLPPTTPEVKNRLPIFKSKVKPIIPDSDEHTYEAYERKLSSDVEEHNVRNFVIAEEMRKTMAKSLSNYNIEVFNDISFPKAWKVLTFNIPSLGHTFPEEEHLIRSAIKLEVASVESMLEYLEALFLRGDDTSDNDIEIDIEGPLHDIRIIKKPGELKYICQLSAGDYTGNYNIKNLHDDIRISTELFF